MSYFYRDMPKEFLKAVEVIKKYCQFEECTENCSECPYSLKTIRIDDESEDE